MSKSSPTVIVTFWDWSQCKHSVQEIAESAQPLTLEINNSDLAKRISRTITDTSAKCALSHINIIISILPQGSTNRRYLAKQPRRKKANIEVFVKASLLSELTPEKFTQHCESVCVSAIFELLNPVQKQILSERKNLQKRKLPVIQELPKSKILANDQLKFDMVDSTNFLELEPSQLTKQLKTVAKSTKAVCFAQASDFTKVQFETIASTLKMRCPNVTLRVFGGNIRTSTDLSFLKYFSFIRNLRISASSLESIEDLEYLSSSLDQLELHVDNPIETSLLPLSALSNLRRLIVSGPFNGFEVLELMPSLQSIHIAEAREIDFGFVPQLPHLFSLSVWKSNCIEFEKLELAKRLSCLRIGSERIQDLDFLSKLSNVQYLILNSLEHVSNFPRMQELKKLRRVELHNMKNIDNLEFLLTIPSLEDVVISGMKHLDVDQFSTISKSKSINSVWTDLGSTEKDVAVKSMLQLPRAKARTQFEFSDLL